jgi:hypothetical protein
MMPLIRFPALREDYVPVSRKEHRYDMGNPNGD